jgi:predicted transcriptional regulator YdeE
MKDDINDSEPTNELKVTPLSEERTDNLSRPEPSQSTPFSSEQEVTGVQSTPDVASPADTTPLGSTGLATPTSKKSKKPLIIGLIIGLLVVLAGTSVAAYNLWYQNSDKVLTDAVMNAVKAKTASYTGTVAITTNDDSGDTTGTAKLTINGKNSGDASEVNVTLAMTNEGKDYSFSGAGLFDKDGNLFLKVNNVRDIIDELNENKATMPKSIDDLIAKVDGNWIKVSASDLKEFSAEAGETQTCVTDAMKKLENDSKATKEIADLYRNNQFVVVKEKLPSLDGSLGYVIDTDSSKGRTFMAGLKNTTAFKEIQKCNEDLSLDENDFFKESSDTSTKSRVEVWVDRWSHQLTKIHITGSDDEGSGDATIVPIFNQAVEVNAPSKFVTISELKQDIEDMQSELMTTESSSSSAMSPFSTLNTSEL